MASEAKSAPNFSSSARSSATSASILAVLSERSGTVLRVERALPRAEARRKLDARGASAVQRLTVGPPQRLTAACSGTAAAARGQAPETRQLQLCPSEPQGATDAHSETASTKPRFKLRLHRSLLGELSAGCLGKNLTTIQTCRNATRCEHKGCHAQVTKFLVWGPRNRRRLVDAHGAHVANRLERRTLGQTIWGIGLDVPGASKMLTLQRAGHPRNSQNWRAIRLDECNSSRREQCRNKSTDTNNGKELPLSLPGRRARRPFSRDRSH